MINKLRLTETEQPDESFSQAKHQAFMKDIAPHLFGGIFSAFFTLYFFYDLSSLHHQILWISSYTVMCVFFAITYFIYFKKNDFFTLKQWVIISHAMVLLLAIYWSLPAFLFLNTDNSLYSVILIFQLLCVCVAPAAAIIYYPIAYVVFISLTMLSMFVFLFISNAEYDFFIHILPLASLTTLLVYGFKLKENVFKTLNLQVENTLAWQSAQQANIAKSTFLAAASHDIRQPLQAVSLLLEAFNESQQTEKEQKLLQHLKSSVNSMSELLNSLLDVSRLDAQVIQIEPEHIALKPLCDSLLLELKQQNQYKPIDFHLQCDDIVAYADPLILKRILNNLLNNALRYTEKGYIALSVKQQENTIIITVIDTGIGIKDDEKNIIFDEFYQSGHQNRQQQKGLGLGLSSVKRLCELHDWDVSFASTHLQGSEFSIAINAGDAKAINSDITFTPSTNLHNVSAVVIDDEASIREGLKNLLEKWGCHVSAYGDPDDAISDLREGTISKPDLVISDYRLGNEKNGIEVIKAIHDTIDERIEAILITGDTGIKQIKDTQRSGLTVLHKPIKPAQLRKVIQLKMKHLI